MTQTEISTPVTGAPTTGHPPPAPRLPVRGLRLPPEVCIKALSDWSLFPFLLNVDEVAWLTGLPVKTVYALNAKGVFAGVVRKIGRQLRFNRDALLRLWTDAAKKATK